MQFFLMLKLFEAALDVQFWIGVEYLDEYKNNAFRMGIVFFF